MTEQEKVTKGLDCCSARPTDCDICPYNGYQDSDGDYPDCKEKTMIDALKLLKWQEQKEQSYISELFRLSNERDKLLKELGREDEHKYKDGSFMAGRSGIVKL